MDQRSIEIEENVLKVLCANKGESSLDESLTILVNVASAIIASVSERDPNVCRALSFEFVADFTEQMISIVDVMDAAKESKTEKRH